MAKLVYGLSQSLDGYVDHMKLGPPAPAAFSHFIGLVRDATGLIYGRRTYEIMRYWEEDLPDWDAGDREFAVVWRSQPKWVVSHSLKSVGPNATLVAGGQPFFAGPRPPLHLVASDLIADDLIRLTYVPA